MGIKTIYKPTKVARENPRVTFLGSVEVAIGGDVQRTPTPPKLPKLIKEATQDQYAQLFTKYPSVIEVEEVETKKPKAVKQKAGDKDLAGE